MVNIKRESNILRDAFLGPIWCMQSMF